MLTALNEHFALSRARLIAYFCRAPRLGGWVCRRALLCFAVLFVCSPVWSQEILRNEEESEAAPDRLLIPFAFYNDTIGLAVGLTYAGRGLLQPQTTFWSTAVVADSGTQFLFFGARDFRTSFADRLLYDVRFAIGDFSEIDVYADGNPDFPDEIAGSNDSDPDNFIQSEGTDGAFDVELRYLLPLGAGREQNEFDVVLRDGLVVAGGRVPKVWNPLKSGLTTIKLRPFYRSQDTDSDLGDAELTTAFVAFSLEYDNTDFSVNPSRGSRQEVSVSRDWGAFDSSGPWTAIAFELSKFVSLGETDKARSRVLALNFWLIDTPTWNSGSEARGFHRPPPYAGASLGGLRRMRGYPEGRFNSRSAVYYTAEYRYIPHWNRPSEWAILKRFNIDLDWLQLVGFAELGRVADEFDLSELHSDMQWSGGVGIRAFANHLIVRAEVAASDEDAILVMSINQPF